MASGLFIESTADMQKSAFKKDHPTSFCSKGLYKYVRMPNYFGEMLFWTGSLVAAFASKMQPYVMISSILGVISSVMIMFASGATLDKKQLQNYGNDPEYLEYRRKTPVIIPLIPLYSLTLEKPQDAQYCTLVLFVYTKTPFIFVILMEEKNSIELQFRNGDDLFNNYSIGIIRQVVDKSEYLIDGQIS